MTRGGKRAGSGSRPKPIAVDSPSILVRTLQQAYSDHVNSGASAATFAVRIGWNKRTLAKVLKGHEMPSVDRVEAALKSCGYSIVMTTGSATV